MIGFANDLKQADIFYGFTSTQLELVASLAKETVYRKGEIIFEEGQDSDELYVIAQGEVDIVVSSGMGGADQGVVIATLRRGQSFGEIALVDRGLRSATARIAQNNTRLLSIPRDKLMALGETYPELGYRLMCNLAADLALKIRSTDLRIRQELLYARRNR